MAAINGSSSEWQTAGKPKSSRTVKALPNHISGAQNDVVMTKDVMTISSTTVTENGTKYLQNGNYSNEGHVNGRRGGHQTTKYQSRPKNPHFSNSMNLSKLTTTTEEALNKRKQIEKEVKNLVKHDAAAERIERLFAEEIQKSHDRLRRAFEEMRQLLNDRERTMIDQLERCEQEGIQLLRQGQDRAKQLRMESERAPSMNDRQINELRDQIRRFLTERRIEEELGRTIRFQFEPDRLSDMIRNFGEVTPVGKDPQKRVSQISLVSSLDDDGSSNSGNCAIKPVSEVTLGGICMKSDSMTSEQLAQLTMHLKESLKLQGIAEDILPDVSGVSGTMPARRRPPERTDHNGHNGNYYQNGRGGRGRFSRGGRRNGETRQY